MNKSILDISEFFSICLQITNQASLIVKETTEKSSHNTKMKGIDDPYTEADVKVQTLAVKALRHVWPNLKIIGEEEEEFTTDLGVDYTKFRTDLIDKSLFKTQCQTKIDLDRCMVWIDPIDGTKDFVKGRMDSVTTLIGLTVDEISYVGMIGKYYTKIDDDKYDFKPKSFFAHSENPQLFYSDFLSNGKISEFKVPSVEDENRLWVITSPNHYDERVNRAMQILNPDKVLKISGLGNKLINVIKGTGDIYCYPRGGAKRWDICAGEAIIKSLGGKLTDCNGNQYRYIPKKEYYDCSNGVMASLRTKTYERVLNLLKKM